MLILEYAIVFVTPLVFCFH